MLLHPQDIDLIEVDRVRSRRSLVNFVKDAWHVLEPKSQALIWGWPLDCITDHLTAVTNGEIRNLLINVPPGFMKSLLVNVLWPAWEWGPQKLPHLRYMSFAYDQRLSLRDNRRCRLLITSQWYQERWGDVVTLTKDQATKDNYENTRRGWRQASTIGGGYSTGERANRLVVDDPHSAKGAQSAAERKEVLFFRREVLPSRMVNPSRDAKICIMQRLHTDDYSGDMLSEEYGDDDLTHVIIPMEFERRKRCFTTVKPRNPIRITPQLRAEVEEHNNALREKLGDRQYERARIDLSKQYLHDPRKKEGELAFPMRFSKEEVAKQKRLLGVYGWSGQGQQDPKPRTGGMFNREHVEIVPAAPSFDQYRIRVRHWDLAGTEATTSNDPDATASVLLAESKDRIIYVLDCKELFIGTEKHSKVLRNTATQDGVGVIVSIPQDPAQAGKFQYKELVRRLAGYRVSRVRESGSKVERAQPFADQWEAGNVKVVKGPWNELFFSRMEAFPVGKKDVPDACSGAYFTICTRSSTQEIESTF